jgi:hypothetical protein
VFQIHLYLNAALVRRRKEGEAWKPYKNARSDIVAALKSEAVSVHFILSLQVYAGFVVKKMAPR